MASNVIRSFILVLPAHNECETLCATLAKVSDYRKTNPTIRFRTYIVENASTDETWRECLRLRDLYPEWVYIFKENICGIGAAYRRAIRESSQTLHLPGTRVVLSAADLPFGFSDLENVGNTLGVAYVGSKAHPKSTLEGRPLSRRLATRILRIIHRLVLGMSTQDTQGTFIVPVEIARKIEPLVKCNGIGFTFELTFWLERLYKIQEVPIRFTGELRPSRIPVFSGSLAMIRSLFRLRVLASKSRLTAFRVSPQEGSKQGAL